MSMAGQFNVPWGSSGLLLTWFAERPTRSNAVAGTLIVSAPMIADVLSFVARKQHGEKRIRAYRGRRARTDEQARPRCTPGSGRARYREGGQRAA